MRIRKSIADLTDDEARELVTALLLLKVKIANPLAREHNTFPLMIDL